jgi:hypothetical protein
LRAALLCPSPNAAVMMRMRGGAAMGGCGGRFRARLALRRWTFAAFLALAMAREGKPVQLRTIDEHVAETPQDVVRLHNQNTLDAARDLKPVRLRAIEKAEPSQRLEVPAKDGFERRTHQPGIEVLIEQEAVKPDLMEHNWGEESTRRNPIPWGWFAVIALAIIGAVIWSLTRVEKADKVAEKLRVKTMTTIVDEEAEDREASRLIDRIEKTIRGYFEADTPDLKSGFVRHPQRVVPLMRRYLSEHSATGARVDSIKALQPITLHNRGNFWMGTVLLTDARKHSLIIEIDPSGKPLIDWETLVCYQPMAWDEFVMKRPAGTPLDFRVHVEPDNFHSHEFSDSQQWTSYRLTALDSEETLFGYAAVGSPQADTLRWILEQNGGRSVSLILRLQIPEDLNSRRGVVIEDVLSSRWIYLDPPDSGS